MPSKGVNPDEVVAIGAAIQGGVLTGEVTCHEEREQSKPVCFAEPKGSGTNCKDVLLLDERKCSDTQSKSQWYACRA